MQNTSWCSLLFKSLKIVGKSVLSFVYNNIFKIRSGRLSSAIEEKAEFNQSKKNTNENIISTVEFFSCYSKQHIEYN